ncbi:ABC transporter ATP-binding protein [Elioraea sp. Yellowstone]|uniref:ABC transporter ATP-binding protein n=1 Tax=Elioraea sp. Yellowstone TaxID=2592070 RepID=UPI00114D96A4|nr:ABC transporter ATP-binding protein [Elioraea sp. Yellowstone]TQF82832.1 ABC transporter ATP-binding protein [Elioraea sp. Yellowstone]
MQTANVAPPGAPEPWRDPEAEPYVRIIGVTKRYGATVAVDDVSLDIYRGELFCLLGGSGSGKTTLLRMLAGFERPDQGRILIDGQDVAAVPPYARPVNMMFQSYALFPHMTVAQNVAFGLRMEGLPRAEIAARVGAMLDLVRLTGLERRRPHELSGGQRQRVALARSLVKRPKLLLLDEPLGALDKSLREQTQFELVNIQERTGITFIMVTHDQEEAMTMATRLAVMHHGYLAQVGTPAEVYEYPQTRLVAEFLGTANVFEGIVTKAGATGALVESTEFDAVFESDTDPPKPVGARVFVAVRPEKMRVRKAAEGERAGTNRLVGAVRDIAYYGDFFMFVVDLPDGRSVRVSQPNLARVTELPITWGDRVAVDWPPLATVVLPE